MILALVMLQQGEVIQPMVAVSPITWENAPKPKSPDSQGRKRVALLILFKDFQRPPAQEMINKLYQALEPDVDINERYNLVTPAELKDSARKLRFSEENRKRSLDTLRGRLGISAAVLITITPRGDKFAIQADMRDTATDRVIAERKAGDVSATELSDNIREIVQALMLH
jgi:hypothetical protein